MFRERPATHSSRVQRRSSGRRSRARGVVLIEALIAIVLFSMGILGVVAMQARSVQMLSEATLRSQAAQHASDLIAEMWLTDPALRATLYASTSATPIRYQIWKGHVQTGARSLPGALDTPPEVAVNTIQTPYSALSSGSQTVSAVTITIFWAPPGAAAVSSYTTTAMILEPQS